jgi:hypothetical protein
MSTGKSFEAFAGHLGVGVKSLYRWKIAHVEFRQAHEIAKVKNLAWFEQLMIAHITGSHKSPQANSNGKTLQYASASMLRWAMSNRFKEYAAKDTVVPSDPNKKIVYRSYVDTDGILKTEKTEEHIDDEQC